MSKIVAGLYTTLDGVVEAPEQWHFDYLADDVQAVVDAQIAATGTMLLGRHTYDVFAGTWPQQGDDNPIAAALNAMPKLVVSRTLQTADWAGTEVVRGDVAAELTRRKAQPGKDITVTGSPTLVRSLLRDGVLDELSLLVHPLVLGRGQRLFPDDGARVPLTLVHATALSTGVVHTVYRPA